MGSAVVTMPKLLVGDMRDLLSEVEDGSVDLVLTDPPYGETSLGWDRRVPNWPALVLPKLKPTGSMWVFGSFRMFMETVDDYRGWKQSQDIVWEKHNGTGLFADRFRRVHELAAHFYPAGVPWSQVYKEPQFTQDARARVVRRKARPAQWIGAQGPGRTYRSEDGGPRLVCSVIPVRSEHGRAVHPTQKPLGILAPLLLYSCPPGGGGARSVRGKRVDWSSCENSWSKLDLDRSEPGIRRDRSHSHLERCSALVAGALE